MQTRKKSKPSKNKLSKFKKLETLEDQKSQDTKAYENKPNMTKTLYKSDLNHRKPIFIKTSSLDQ